MSSEDGTTTFTSTFTSTSTTTTTTTSTTTSVDEGSEGGGSSGDESTAADESGSTGADVVGPRYDEVRQKSAHNSYQRLEAIVDQLLYHRVRSIELDIHVGKSFEDTVDGNWFVYHTDVTDDETWCVRLDDCLAEVASFHRAIGSHEIVTVWVDLKDPWDDAHGPAELDARIDEAFGAAVLAPDELLAGCDGAADVQSAVAQCGWPELVDLRGRVMVVLTGGAGNLRTYHDEPGPRLAFVAPAIGDVDAIADWPNTDLFNFAAADVALAGEVAAAGHVVRVWDNNDEASWDAAVGAGAHHIATDKVSYQQDPWAITHDAAGWPFTCLDACAAIGPEPGTVIGIDVDSGDLWAQSDSAWLVHDDRSASPDGSWTALVSTANSHVEPFAKGCLMARASTADDAPYFAVCRPADEEPLRVQWRATQAADSSAIEADVAQPGTVDPPGVAFVRMRVSQGGTCVAGDGSRDGASWIEIGSHCFAEPLALQGIAASSHDAGVVRLLFAEVRRDDGDARDLASFAASAQIGTGSAVVYDGVMP